MQQGEAEDQLHARAPEVPAMKTTSVSRSTAERDQANPLGHAAKLDGQPTQLKEGHPFPVVVSAFLSAGQGALVVRTGAGQGALGLQ